ncbi:hypothetical protein GSI_00114 [Ganoderma sinense ZZ0214-1]|uniref:Uncharacterized protein n=1 Tax=Ganoderma sinense ZZ0214-1 TaxID=1077348 RepID=A0A2G8SRN1_9APHY|nr:hypothetical protein GSI_00114 [Ganoderma sinense ZZ0214-1]
MPRHPVPLPYRDWYARFRPARIVEKLMAALHTAAAHGGNIHSGGAKTFRRAPADHPSLLLNLENGPVARQAGLNPRFPARTDHCATSNTCCEPSRKRTASRDSGRLPLPRHKHGEISRAQHRFGTQTATSVSMNTGKTNAGGSRPRRVRIEDVPRRPVSRHPATAPSRPAHPHPAMTQDASNEAGRRADDGQRDVGRRRGGYIDRAGAVRERGGQRHENRAILVRNASRRALIVGFGTAVLRCVGRARFRGRRAGFGNRWMPALGTACVDTGGTVGDGCGRDSDMELSGGLPVVGTCLTGAGSGTQTDGGLVWNAQRRV